MRVSFPTALRSAALRSAARRLCHSEPFGGVAADKVPVDGIPWITRPSASRQFLQGHPHLHLTWYLERETGASAWRRLYGQIIFGAAGCEGPPGHAHGGSVAAVLDEGMGACAWLNEQHVLTSEIAVRYLAPVPLDTPVELLAEIEEIAGRRVMVRGELASPALSCVFASSTGTFIHQPAWSASKQTPVGRERDAGAR